jgi:hypothetical protein
LIEIAFPSENSVVIKLSEWFIGQFSPDESPAEELISFRADIDALSEGMKLYHETNVAHIQAEGSFRYYPIYLDLTSSPTTTYPKRAAYHGYLLPSTIATTHLANHGLGQVGSYDKNSSSHYRLYQADRSGLEQITCYEGTLTSLCTVDRDVFQITKITSDRCYYTRTRYRRTVRPSSLGIKSWNELSVDSSLNQRLWDAGTNETVTNYNPTSVQTIRPYTTPSTSVTGFRGWINTLAIPSIEELPFPHAGVHYGELAQEASQKVNRNQVNMIAFLRDLRDPRALIPKLKNLQKLKTHAGNYLAFEYGILPTLDDLKAIAAAFAKHKPYIDRNGFKTYNAFHSESSGDGIDTFTLEQRIKLAIADEDNGFIDLMNRVESSGFAPTFENVWDLIPYSFVLDWFINVGDFLERVDSRMRLARLDIQYVTMSRKSVKQRVFSASSNNLYGGILKLVQYSRWTEDHCPVPPLFLLHAPTVSDHWLEASALIIQRAK